MTRLALLCGLAALLAVPLARGLVVLEEGKSQLFVTTAAEATWDSNVFSNADEVADFYETARLGLDYERNAGLLTASAGVEWAYSHFERLHDESSALPSAHASLARKRGRLTARPTSRTTSPTSAPASARSPAISSCSIRSTTGSPSRPRRPMKTATTSTARSMTGRC